MNANINYTNTPHTLTIKNRKSKELILKKVLPTESEAFRYLNEVRAFKDNSTRLTFSISGSNCFYYC